MYKLCIANNKLIGIDCLGYQEQGVSYPISKVEVSEEIYNDYKQNPDKYIYKDGQIVESPDYEEMQKQKEKERINSLTMTKRVLALGLQKLGISYTQLKELIASNEQAQLEWDLCIELERSNPLLDLMGSQLGITSEQIDEMFRIANGEDTGATKEDGTMV